MFWGQIDFKKPQKNTERVFKAFIIEFQYKGSGSDIKNVEFVTFTDVLKIS